LGYPYNLDFDYGALEKLVKFSINNLGDPFIESNYGVHSREFEVRRKRGDSRAAACLHMCMCMAWHDVSCYGMAWRVEACMQEMA